MLLLDKYYTISGKSETENGYTVNVNLNPDHKVYEGHFPGEPVSPGVCTLQMIREVSEIVTGYKLKISSLKQVKYSALIIPTKNQNLVINITMKWNEDTATVNSTVTDGETTFITIKGDFVKA